MIEGPSVKEEGVEEPVSQVTQTSEIQSCNPEVDPSQSDPENMEVEKEITSSVEQQLQAELLKSNPNVLPVTKRLG